MKRGLVCVKYIQNGRSDEKHLRMRSGVLQTEREVRNIHSIPLFAVSAIKIK
jgi:hypothetical protein